MDDLRDGWIIDFIKYFRKNGFYSKKSDEELKTMLAKKLTEDYNANLLLIIEEIVEDAFDGRHKTSSL